MTTGAIILWVPSGGKDVDPDVQVTPRTLFQVLEKHTNGLEADWQLDLRPNIPASTPADVVLAMGKAAFATLQAAGYFPKNRVLSGYRGVLRTLYTREKTPEGRLLVTYHPLQQFVEEGAEYEVAWDMRLANRVLTTGTTEARLGDYRWVADFSDMVRAIDEHHAKSGEAVPVAFDCETQGDCYGKGFLVSLQAAWQPGKADAVYMLADTPTKALHDSVTALLTRPYISLRGANLKYDLAWIERKMGIACTNFRLDTLIAGSLIDETRSNSLNMHAKIYVPELGGYDDEFNRTVDKEKMAVVDRDKLLPYAAGDADAALRVSNVMRDELLADTRLGRLYVTILHPASRELQRMEYHGVCVDRGKLAAIGDQLRADIAAIDAKQRELMPHRLRAKYADGLDMSRPVVLKDYFFSPAGLNLKPLETTPKTGQPSMSKKHLLRYVDVPEAKAMAELVEQRGVAEKMLNTYVDGWMPHIRPDGRFHPTYFMFSGFDDKLDDEGGTVTGRLSAKNPAIQTTPKKNKYAKLIRKALVAPPGYGIVSCDFSQGELKIIACLANCTNMLGVYARDGDLHCATAAGINGLSYDDFVAMDKTDHDKYELWRGQAKPANFGLIYGMMAPKYQRYARDSYRVFLSLEEAERQRNGFFDTYPELLAYHDARRAEAKANGYVRSPMGRKRNLSLIYSPNWAARGHAERQAINFPVQSTLSELMLWSFVEVGRQLPDVIPVANIHDAGIWYVPLPVLEERGRQIRAIMGSLPIRETFGWDHQIPFTADCEYSATSLGEMQKMPK